MAVSEELRRKREELVIEHMESENRHEYDATIETFDHPRYELIGTGDVYDGPRGGRALLRGDAHRLPRPAQRADRPPPRRRRGDRRGQPATAPTTGRSAACRRPAASSRCGSAPCSCSRRTGWSASASTSTPNTILRQLGIAHDPLSLSGRLATVLNHPLTVGRRPHASAARAADRPAESQPTSAAATGGGP